MIVYAVWIGRRWILSRRYSPNDAVDLLAPLHDALRHVGVDHDDARRAPVDAGSARRRGSRPPRRRASTAVRLRARDRRGATSVGPRARRRSLPARSGRRLARRAPVRRAKTSTRSSWYSARRSSRNALQARRAVRASSRPLRRHAARRSARREAERACRRGPGSRRARPRASPRAHCSTWPLNQLSIELPRKTCATRKSSVAGKERDARRRRPPGGCAGASRGCAGGARRSSFTMFRPTRKTSRTSRIRFRLMSRTRIDVGARASRCPPTAAAGSRRARRRRPRARSRG